MSWIGKTVGAGLGGVILGPFGAAAGAALGHWFDTATEVSVQESWRMQYFSILGAAAQAGCASLGRLSPKVETHLIRTGKYMLNCDDEPGVRTALVSILQKPPSAEECGQVIFLSNDETRGRLMGEILSIWYADGAFPVPVENWAERLVRSSGVPGEDWVYLSCFFEPPNFSAARLDRLKILSLPAEATATDIKKAYWNLCREYHPDGNLNASDQLRKLGEDKLREINDASEFLTHGLDRHFQVCDQSGNWRQANDVSAGFVALCPLCAQASRVNPETILQSRCAICHALLAQTKEFISSLKGQPR